VSGHETGWHLLALPTTIEGSPAMIGVWIACIPTVVPGVQIGLAWLGITMRPDTTLGEGGPPSYLPQISPGYSI